jgi:hypothetical protein
MLFWSPDRPLESVERAFPHLQRFVQERKIDQEKKCFWVFVLTEENPSSSRFKLKSGSPTLKRRFMESSNSPALVRTNFSG